MSMVLRTGNPFLLLLNYLMQQWLLIAAAAGVVVTSLFLHRMPKLDRNDLEVLWILGVLFIAVAGLERSGITRNLAQRMEQGRMVPLKLVSITFFLSMLVTNDVALLAVVPMTLMLNNDRKALLVILEALAANAGSALTPFGNPQNLFIYWHYKLSFTAFVLEIAPFSALFLLLLLLAALFVRPDGNTVADPDLLPVDVRVYVHAVLLVLAILCMLGLLPLLTTLVIPIYALIFDRRSLKVDFSLLLTFVCFFGLTDNLQTILSVRLEHPDHVFLLTACASQLISNVPATLLVSGFTDDWEALLWGANVGGFGSLMGSLANLIAYRLYVNHSATADKLEFTVGFVVFGVVAFLIGSGLYWLI